MLRHVLNTNGFGGGLERYMERSKPYEKESIRRKEMEAAVGFAMSRIIRAAVEFPAYRGAHEFE